MGTMKDEFLVALREFQADCGGPSFRTLARISQTLKALYQPSADPVCDLHGLSPATMSEVLSGKRLGPPSFDWVASFVLSCQRFAVRDRPARRDQGTTILAHWAAIYAAHVGEWGAAPEAGGWSDRGARPIGFRPIRRGSYRVTARTARCCWPGPGAAIRMLGIASRCCWQPTRPGSKRQPGC